jgi:pilus assembly protein Flp/PilA
METFFSCFTKDNSGATAIEYGLIGLLISVGIIAAATQLGNDVSTTFTTVGTKVTSATATGIAGK